MRIDPFNHDDWRAIVKEDMVDSIPEGAEFIMHITVISKSGNEYVDQEGPHSLEEIHGYLQGSEDVVDAVRDNDIGVAQIGHTFIRFSEIESVTVINFYKDPL